MAPINTPSSPPPGQVAWGGGSGESLKYSLRCSPLKDSSPPCILQESYQLMDSFLPCGIPLNLCFLSFHLGPRKKSSLSCFL